MSVATGKGATFVSKSEGWDKAEGAYTEFVWEGTRAAIYGMVANTKTLADSYQIEHTGALYKIRFRVAGKPGDFQEITDEIRMEAHRVVKDLCDLNLDGLTAAQIAEVKQAVEDNEIAPEFSDPAQDSLFDELIYGNTSKVIYQPVLIRTSTASRNYGFVPDYSLNGRIIHPNSIGKAVGAVIPLGLPNDPDPGDNRTAYGWLQHAPTYVLSANYKAQLSTEWEYGRWSIYSYGSPVVL